MYQCFCLLLLGYTSPCIYKERNRWTYFKIICSIFVCFYHLLLINCQWCKIFQIFLCSQMYPRNLISHELKIEKLCRKNWKIDKIRKKKFTSCWENGDENVVLRPKTGMKYVVSKFSADFLFVLMFLRSQQQSTYCQGSSAFMWLN